MNNKKLVALLLAAMMSVSTASVAFAAPDDVLVQGDPPTAQIWEGKLYSAMLKAGDEEGGNKDGKLTEGEAAAITSLDVTGLQFGALAGLEYCKGLTSLTVTGSQVQDLWSIAGWKRAAGEFVLPKCHSAEEYRFHDTPGGNCCSGWWCDRWWNDQTCNSGW